MDNVLLTTLCIVLVAMSAILVMSLAFVGTREEEEEAPAPRPHRGPAMHALPPSRVARLH